MLWFDLNTANFIFGANAASFDVCRQCRLSLMILPCMQRGAFAGCIWVNKTRLWMMLIPTELWRWIYPIPAMSKQRLWYWWRWAVAELHWHFVSHTLLYSLAMHWRVCLGVRPSMYSTRIGIKIGLEKRRSGLKLDFSSEITRWCGWWRNLGTSALRFSSLPPTVWLPHGRAVVTVCCLMVTCLQSSVLCVVRF
jgi:hypothetical protein